MFSQSNRLSGFDIETNIIKNLLYSDTSYLLVMFILLSAYYVMGKACFYWLQIAMLILLLVQRNILQLITETVFQSEEKKQPLLTEQK